MNSILSSLIVVIPSILVCLALLLLVRKLIPLEELRSNHEVAGFTLGIIGVLYSVILGFTVVNVQNRYNEVLHTVHTEAVSIADLYREAEFFPAKGRTDIRTSLRAYVTYVTTKEWRHQKDKLFHLEAHNIIAQIWNAYYEVDIDTEKTRLWYQSSISKLNTFINTRLARQFSSWERLSPMMWAILILGAITSISFMYFFGLKRLRAHMIMVGILSGYISFMLYLVFCLDNVYSGPEAIQPTVFEDLFIVFDHWDTHVFEPSSKG